MLGSEHGFPKQTIVAAPVIEILPLVRFGAACQTLFGSIVQTGNAEGQDLKSSNCGPLVVVGRIGSKPHLGSEDMVVVIADAKVLGAPVAV